tara:strand:+ start:178 stop:2046 length:1869 start_codon:yes stop_codon:yes gene_type:complete
MNIHLRIFFFFIILCSCDKVIDEKLENYYLIDENSKAVLNIKNLGKFKNSIINNKYLNLIFNSNLSLKNLINDINQISNDKQIIVGLYGDDELLYDIIGNKIINDTNNLKKYHLVGNIDLITNNTGKVPKINKTHFVNKFKKMNQTNENFSIALDSKLTKKFMNRVFGRKNFKINSNLILNVNAKNDLIVLDGLIDNYNLKLNNKENQLKLEEIKNNDVSIDLDYYDNLINDYDFLNTNQELNFNFFEFENSKSNHNNLKIFQFKNGDNVVNVNGLISDSSPDSLDLQHNLKFKVSIPNEIILGPIIVKNHINDKNEIMIQDNENKVYLIDNNGQVEWTKKIDGKIIEDIFQIDSYKNGEMQYVFNTEKKLYVLDRKGRNVGRFPLNFNDKITKPVSIFDYDKNKNYRLLITQSNELFMFDIKGSRVKGFDYKKSSEIITKPKHFRIANKDIIVFKTLNKLLILNRRGKIRIKPEKKYKYSNEEVYQYKNYLITTSDKNEILKISTDGKISVEKTIAFNSLIVANYDHIVILEKNLLSNLENNTEIQFGKFDKLKIFKLNKNDFIRFHDVQNNKLYFLNSKLIIQKGFPIYSKGSTDFNVYNKKTEFSLKSDSQTIKFFRVK